MAKQNLHFTSEQFTSWLSRLMQKHCGLITIETLKKQIFTFYLLKNSNLSQSFDRVRLIEAEDHFKVIH
jgi:hypothetical protein